MNYKRQLGQYLTDKAIANYMINLSKPFLHGHDFLDPCSGPGVFATQIKENDLNGKMTCYEINEEMIELFKENTGSLNDIVINNGNYLYTDTPKRYDLKLSGHSNYCIYFLIKSF